MTTILPRLVGILANLRTLHENDNTPCPGPSNCPLLAIMGDVESLMDDVAKEQGDPEPACVPPQDIDTTRLNFMEAHADERWWFISGPGTKSGMTAREAIDAVMATGFECEDDVASKVEECQPREPQPPMAPKDEMIFNAWLELHHVLEWEVPNPGMEWWAAARPMLVKSDAILTQLITGIENLPPIAYMPIDPDPEFQAAELLPAEPDTTAIADAIIRAQSNPAAKFMPAQRLCLTCDQIIPEDHPGPVCERCLL